MFSKLIKKLKSGIIQDKSQGIDSGAAIAKFSGLEAWLSTPVVHKPAENLEELFDQYEQEKPWFLLGADVVSVNVRYNNGWLAPYTPKGKP